MKFTNAEKLIVTMLADLHEKLEIDEVNTKLIKQAIYSNNTWALSWELPGIVGDPPEPTPPEVSLIVDILDMWSFIEEAHERFDATEKSALEAKADPFGKHVAFSGFDGNNESEYMSIANFLVKEMNRFTRFADRDLNSHCQVIDGYQRMLAKFLEIRPKLDGRGLSIDEMADVLNARRHSSF
ncbi:hypothetical protein B9Z45_04020 [Limnohabitans sp. 2KL-17]|uniref:YfbU family protein n=1 Tax=Limnohabitans sp. 2KL-17 TaxID=1100704 RepID=UPI000D345905|nr:YfbU family protein [Limnohabitans sp. 2KL-17]PUE62500.1 hypothetical protein B9Z45_04020 [Limnohabitans sp. 2KL-17]